MARASIETKDGTKIQIEGTTEEISKIMGLYKKENSIEDTRKFKKFIRKTTSPTVPDMIRELIAEGFFDRPKGLAEIKTSLEEQGHFIPMTTLSARVLGLIKNRELRRIKQDDKWRYVKR